MLITEKNKQEERKWLWVPCPKNLFKPAFILEETLLEVKVQSNTVETFKHCEVFKMNPNKFDREEDLANLSHLNEPGVLHNLQTRYLDTKIYTYSGLFLLALNPYKKLSIYTDEYKEKIRKTKEREFEPHIFAVANEAYSCMLSNKTNQSILITGESGAGKTENTKKVIEYLAYVAGTSQDRPIEQLLVSANPILEAFGNAKTVKNDNSSRFGKFIQLKFKGGKICGARIEKYLLERSRVASQNKNERSYHVFYYLLAGASPELSKELKLTGNPSDFNCLKNSLFYISGTDDKDEFEKLNKFFSQMGIDDTKKFYNLVAAVLHLSNIEFTEENDRVEIKNFKAVEIACELLGVPTEEFTKEILHPTIKAGTETVVHYRNLEECQKVLEGLMKLVYDSLFDSLVSEINSILDRSYSDYFIGVLDIAGFEIFEKNSFEQLCINYTNEKLQQFFNHHMFILEQEIYKNECIEWNFIDFGLDLEPTIKVIEGSSPIGILSYLDEECVMPKATDKTLLEKIHSIPTIEKVPFKESFRLKHYAGLVEYETKGWLDKNKDIHSNSLHEIISNKLNIKKNSEMNIKKGIFRTIAQSHRENLRKLMFLLCNTSPHFVRCILPNLEKSSEKFDKKLILDQLRCNGVLEGIRISRLGYPSRVSFEDFNFRYLILHENKELSRDLTKELSNDLTKELSEELTRDLTKELTRDLTKDLNRDLSEDLTRDLSEDLTRDLSEDLTKDLTKDLSKDLNRDLSEDLTKDLYKDYSVSNIPKELSIQILESSKINPNEFKIGNSLVFLKQGVLAELEVARHRKVCEVSMTIQSVIREKIETRKKNLLEIRNNAILLLQKNFQFSHEFLKWRWWSLFIKIKPLLEVQKTSSDLKEKEEQIKAYSEIVERERAEKKKLEDSLFSSKSLVQELQNSLDSSITVQIEQESILETLRGENQILRSEIKNNTDLINEKLLEDQKIKLINNQLICQISDLRNEVSDKQTTIEKLMEKDGDLLDSKEQEISLLKKQLFTENKKSIEIKESLFNKEKELENIKTEKINTENSLKESLNNYKEITKKMKGELDDFSYERETLLGQLKKIENKKVDLERLLNSSILEKEFYSAKYSSLEQSNKSNLEMISSLEKQLLEYSIMKDSKEESYSNLLKQNKTLNIKINNLESLVENLTKEKEEIFLETQKLAKEKIEALCSAETKENMEKKALQLEIQKLKTANEKLQRELTSSSSFDEFDCTMEKLNKNLETEKTTRKITEKRLFETETQVALLENKIRENNHIISELNEKNLKLTEEYSNNYIPKEHLSKNKEQIENIRNSLNEMAVLFQRDFQVLLNKKFEQTEELIQELVVLKEKNTELECSINRNRNADLLNKTLEKELEEQQKSKSFLKTEMDDLSATNRTLRQEIKELNVHIEKLENLYNSRENEIEKIRDEYSPKVETFVNLEKELKRKVKETEEMIDRIGSINENVLVESLNKKIGELTMRIVENENKVLMKESEIGKLQELLKIQKELYNNRDNRKCNDDNCNHNNNNCNHNNNCNLIDLKQMNLVEKHKIVSTFISDKEALKAIELKAQIRCNCSLMGTVKIVTVKQTAKEEIIRLENENSLLNLRIKQNERELADQIALGESMKSCITAIKKRK